jgi:hypothetical protein
MNYLTSINPVQATSDSLGILQFYLRALLSLVIASQLKFIGKEI